MNNRYTLALLAVIFSAVFFCELSMAKEDTAQIILKKTATSKQNLYTYTVKKGDMISTIVRHIPNINNEDIKDNYKIIKDLNPDISDLNKLLVGQLLVLPGKPLYETQQKMELNTSYRAATAVSPKNNPVGDNTYVIKKGENLIGIIHRELKIKTNTQPVIDIIKSLNPNVIDFNRIYAGQIIKLPNQNFFVKAAEEDNGNVQQVVKQAESQKQPEEILSLIHI